MLNIPTDLLRTLVAVVDLRSFTKAAQSLGVTQPAVSAQVKRLQYLLGYDVLDKRTPGVSLTPRGEIVVTHARRLLSCAAHRNVRFEERAHTVDRTCLEFRRLAPREDRGLGVWRQ